MTDMAAAPMGAPPPGPPPVALAVAHALVTRYRLRLADQRDSRLGPLLGRYALAAGSWTGKRASLVAFYDPPADPVAATADAQQRCAQALSWGSDRLGTQGAEHCDVLLVALRPLPPMQVQTGAGAVRVGLEWIDAANGNAGSVAAPPKGLPSAGDLRRIARDLAQGAPAPTLAAVDLAERETVAAGYAAPVRTALTQDPRVCLVLIGIFVLIWLVERGSNTLRYALEGYDLQFGVNVVANHGTDTFVNGTGFALDWWRYVTSAFLHADTPLHVLINSYSMFILGRLIEQLYGRTVMLGTFLLTAIGGNAFWLVCTVAGVATGPVDGLGASGGITGFLGILLVLGRVQGRGVPVGVARSLRNVAVQNVVLLALMGFFLGGQVNNWVHAGGVLSGALVGLVLPPLAAVGGRSLSVYERVALYMLFAACAAALLYGAHLAVDVAGGLTTA